ncbi:hypothetical protein [Micromonospora sp. NBC_00421]
MSNSSSSAQQVGQTIRATGDLSPTKRHTAVDQTLNPPKRGK